MQGLPNHNCHEDLKSLKWRYAEEIKSMKKQHWTEWLENIEGKNPETEARPESHQKP